MTLLLVKNKKILDLPAVWRLALKLVYEPENMSLSEQQQMKESIVSWKQHLDLRKEFGFNAVDEENQCRLELIAKLLKDDQEDLLLKRKITFKVHNIDYKKFYRLPEAYTKQDFINGQKTLEKHKKENPEEYN